MVGVVGMVGDGWGWGGDGWGGLGFKCESGPGVLLGFEEGVIKGMC